MNKELRKRWLTMASGIEYGSLCLLCKYSRFFQVLCGGFEHMTEYDSGCLHPLGVVAERHPDIYSSNLDCWGFRPGVGAINESKDE
jgi:hypothetical protein